MMLRAMRVPGVAARCRQSGYRGRSGDRAVTGELAVIYVAAGSVLVAADEQGVARVVSTERRLDGRAAACYWLRRNGVAHVSAASLMRFCTAGSRESGELLCFFSLPLTKYMPDASASAGSAARRTYCCAPRCIPAATKKGITWLIRIRMGAGPSKCSEPLLPFTRPGSSRLAVTPQPAQRRARP